MRPAAILCNGNRQSCGDIMDIRGWSVVHLSQKTDHLQKSHENQNRIFQPLFCSESNMCIENKYYESLANGSFFVIKLGQVWRLVIKDN